MRSLIGVAAPSPFLRPDVLVLAGGGIVGEAWMHGVLAGIEDAAEVDFRDVESYVGTSAGSMVCARLAGGKELPRPPDVPSSAGTSRARADERGGSLLKTAARWSWALTAPLAPAAVAAGTPAGGIARAALLSRVPTNGRSLADLRTRVARWGTRFDGRLRVCAVDKRRGRRVVFGAPGEPRADVADAVCASCAIPWVFAPIVIGGREYVDGGVWSATNLDAAPATRGTHVLCLNPTANIGLARSPLGAVRQAVRVAAAVEIQLLRRRGARVKHIGPDGDCVDAMGVNFMDSRPLARVLAAGYRQGLKLGS